MAASGVNFGAQILGFLLNHTFAIAILILTLAMKNTDKKKTMREMITLLLLYVLSGLGGFLTNYLIGQYIGRITLAAYSISSGILDKLFFWSIPTAYLILWLHRQGKTTSGIHTMLSFVGMGVFVLIDLIVMLCAASIMRMMSPSPDLIGMGVHILRLSGLFMMLVHIGFFLYAFFAGKGWMRLGAAIVLPCVLITLDLLSPLLLIMGFMMGVASVGFSYGLYGFFLIALTLATCRFHTDDPEPMPAYTAPQTLYCPSCGTPVMPGALFCPGCGCRFQ